jgi:LacI family transcriptional regulator
MKKTRPTTLKDVASYAGVSIKTVSNVVNDWPYITSETRQKVLDAIRVLGYRPNSAARTLVTGKTRTVGVLIPDISNPFFGTAIRGCEDILFKSGYSLLLTNTNEDLSRERNNLELLLSRGVDALILWGTRINGQELEEVIGPQLPLVTVELSIEPTRPNHANINVENQAGALLATRHLLNEGYTRIAHLAGPLERVTAQLRQTGYRQAIEEAGLQIEEVLIVNAAPTIPAGYEAVKELLRSQRPQAIFCYNDLMAFGALIAAREMGLEVPKDLALVGFDDISMDIISDPPLSTVRISQYDLGYMAGEIVLKLLQAPSEEPISYPFPVELIIRGSSRGQPLTSKERKSKIQNLLSSFTPDLQTNPVDQAKSNFDLGGQNAV